MGNPDHPYCAITSTSANDPFSSQYGTPIENSFPESSQPTHLKSLKSSNLIIWGTERYGNPSLAGYNPRNGDFEIEHANNAEEIISVASKMYDYSAVEDNKEDQKLMKELQITLGEVYNSKLQERETRKKMIKDHGLINLTGTRKWYSQLEKVHGLAEAKKLIRLAQLMTAEEAQYFYSSLELVTEMKFNLNKLMFYRSEYGIKKLSEYESFDDEKKKRTPKSDRLDLRSVINPNEYPKKKKTALEIFHLPKFKELTSRETELCSSVGLYPEFFLTTKGFLLADCKKTNGMLLKRARKMVKIDVNKTRKIYDFLLEHGVLWPPVDQSAGGYPLRRKEKKK